MSKASNLFSMLVVISIMLAILGIAGYLVMRALRRQAQDSTAAGAEPFTLQSLREMRAAGQITEQEFEAMKASLIGRATAPKPSPKPPARTRPPLSDTDFGDTHPL